LGVAAVLLLALPLIRTDSAGADEPDAKQQKRLTEVSDQSKDEAAIARGLNWLASQQKEDGSWEFERPQPSWGPAATALGVLPFLGAGVNPPAKNDRKYSSVVERALGYLLKEQKKTPDWGGYSYTIALCTLAMAEAYALTGDENYGKSAQKGVDLIVAAQTPDGGWSYHAPTTRGDTSNTGWTIQALYSAKKAGLKVPDEVLTKAEKYLISVMLKDGVGYGYTSNEGPPRPTMTASGLFSRALIGGEKKEQALKDAIPTVMKQRPEANAINYYHVYYATMMMHHRGGDDWTKYWYPKVRDVLLGLQTVEKGDKEGSWDADKAPMGIATGRLGCTSLAVLSLEANFKYLRVMR
jgi:hypothetical protein